MSPKSSALTLTMGDGDLLSRIKRLIFPSSRSEEKLANLHREIKEATASGERAADAFERLASKPDPFGAMVHKVKGAQFRERIRRGDAD